MLHPASTTDHIWWLWPIVALCIVVLALWVGLGRMRTRYDGNPGQHYLTGGTAAFAVAAAAVTGAVFISSL